MSASKIKWGKWPTTMKTGVGGGGENVRDSN